MGKILVREVVLLAAFIESREKGNNFITLKALELSEEKLFFIISKRHHKFCKWNEQRGWF